MVNNVPRGLKGTHFYAALFLCQYNLGGALWQGDEDVVSNRLTPWSGFKNSSHVRNRRDTSGLLGSYFKFCGGRSADEKTSVFCVAVRVFVCRNRVWSIRYGRSSRHSPRPHGRSHRASNCDPDEREYGSIGQDNLG